jgi:hypothetical protein
MNQVASSFTVHDSADARTEQPRNERAPRDGQSRWDAAEESLPAVPPLDITWAKVGDRYGYVITTPDGGPIDITISVHGIEGDVVCGVKDDNRTGYIRVAGGLPPERGISQGRVIGAIVGK